MHPHPGVYRPAQPATPTANVLLAIGAVVVGVWIVGVTALLQVVGWGLTEARIELGQDLTSWQWPIIAAVNGLLVVVPAILIWLLGRQFAPTATGVVAAGRAWTLAGAAGALVGLARTVQLPFNEVLLLLTAVITVVLGILVRLVPPRRARDAGPAAVRAHVAGFGVAAGLLALLPWLWAGALGGIAETVLAVCAALGVGWLAAGILDRAFFARFGRSRPWQVLVGGLTAGVALAALIAGVGGFGVGVVELFAIPGLGFAAAAIASSVTRRSTPSDVAPSPAPPDVVPMPPHQAVWSPAALAPQVPARPAPPSRRDAFVAPGRGLGLAVSALVALGALGPLAFVDPEETTLVLGLSDVGRWALIAALISALVGLVVGLILVLTLSPRRRLRGWIPAAAALVVAVAAVGVYAGAGRPGFYGDRLFVVMKSQADLSGLETIADRPSRLTATYDRLVEHAEQTQAPLLESLDRWNVHYTPYYLVNAVLVDGGTAVRQWLAGRDDVDRALIDQRLRPLPARAPTDRGPDTALPRTPLWNITMIGADRAWSELGSTGSGIVIGTSDSGVDGNHPTLKDGYRGGDDSWYDPWNRTVAPVDHNGHGTHTLGSAVGRDGIGVAPGAEWIGCVNLDRNLGSPSLYLDCLQFMLAPFPPGGDPLRDGRPSRAAHVLTNSWGCPELEGCDLVSLRPAVDALRAAGIFVVAAAGNSGPDCSTVDDPPAPYDSAFTVGAVDRTAEVARFSSRGPTSDGRIKPDLVAPGVDILSSLPGSTYGTLSGTSMATPHVAGAVALMWSANPALIGDIATTDRILRDTTTPADPSGQNTGGDRCQNVENITGTGIVNAFAAVRAASSVEPR